MFANILCYFCVVCTLAHCIRSQPVDDEETIDLTHLGSKLFRNPDYEFSKDLSADHPEEQGPYLQGDLLIPPGTSKNGMKSESYRWKNGEIPYVIRGRFSKCKKIIKKIVLLF